MKVLAIESSCDETAVAVYDNQRGLLANQIYSQVALHAKYGGVVPELASRDHLRKITPLIKTTLKQAQLTLQDIEGIAYTAGPGLMGALFVGAALARSLAWSLNIPALGIHHMEGHLLAVMLEEHRPNFPFVALLVSGGHTLLIHVRAMGCYDILGESLDDAVGEAFDKTAKLLGLPYPGGPQLAKLAEQGNPDRFRFPRPMTNRPGLDFSFSGLKTFALNTLNQAGHDSQTKADIAYAFQQAVAETMLIKCRRALSHTQLQHLVVAGGVAANHCLRQCLNSGLDAEIYYPRIEFCTDNAAMIAFVGCQRLMAGEYDDLTITAKSRWPLSELSPIPNPVLIL